MASNDVRRKNKRHSFDILNQLANHEEIHLWLFLLETKKEEITKELQSKNISLILAENGHYIATTEYDKGKEEICDFFHRFSFGYKAVRITVQGHNKKMKTYDHVKYYTQDNCDDVWIVGEKVVVDKIVCEMNEVKEDVERVENPEARMETVDIPLAQKDQALIYLSKQNFLNEERLNVVKAERYRVEIHFESDDKEEISAVEKNLKKRLQSVKSKVYSSESSFDANIIKFLSTEQVYEYVDKELNCFRNIQCVWYIDETKNTITIYTEKQYDLKKYDNQIRSAICSIKYQIPPKCFCSTFTTENLTKLDEKYQGKLKLQFDSNCSKLLVVCTKDIEYRVTSCIKSLFLTKSLDVRDREKALCFRKLLNAIQEPLEDKYKVDIKEEESSTDGKYCVIIQGNPSPVDLVYRELKALKDSMKCVEKDFKTNFSTKPLYPDIESLADRLQFTVEIKEVKQILTKNPVDLQVGVVCHSWILPNGSALEVINGDEPWLMKDSVLLQISLIDEQISEAVNFWPEKKVVVMNLPHWKENVNQEKEVLRSTLNKLFQMKEVIHIGSPYKIGLLLNETVKHGWPWKKFLKEVLSALSRKNVRMLFAIFEPSKPEFDKASDILQEYASSVYKQQRIKTAVKTGELAKEKVGAIVNSSNENLTLKSGAVSSSILYAAGESIQNECNDVMKRRHQKLVSSKDVIVTLGYQLQCRYVFHGALGVWNRQTLEEFVWNCLREADLYRLSTIAFPSLGTGNLNYPAPKVAEIMFHTVERYATHYTAGSLREVLFVIYPKDTKALQAFLNEEKRPREGRAKSEKIEKNPNPFFTRIQVTGKEDKLEQAFVEIEKILRLRCDKSKLDEPHDQSISRNEFESGNNQEQMEHIKKDNGKEFDIENNEKKMEPVKRERWADTDESGLATSYQTGKSCKRTDASYDDERNNEQPSVSIQILENSKDQYSVLIQDLKRYSIDENQIIWCPYTSNKARIKLNHESDVDRLTDQLKFDEKYKVEQYNAEAVVNIKAKLNTAMNDYLNGEEYIKQLKKQSGVGVIHDSGGTLTLTGSLSEISDARAILIKWKLQQYIPVKNKISDNVTRGDSLNLNPENTVIVKHATADRRVLEENGSLTICCSVSLPSSSDEEDANKTIKKRDLENVSISDTKDDQQLRGAARVSTFYEANQDSLVMRTNEGVEVYVYQGDICKLKVDAIVNSSNKNMNHHTGLASIIAKAAGSEMTEACSAYLKNNKTLMSTNICFTTSGNLKHYRGIFHVCSPIWNERSTKDKFFTDLSQVIEKALEQANRQGMKSIAIPAVGSGGRGGPRQLCFSTYPNGITDFSNKYGNSSTLREVHFVDIDEEVIHLIQTACLLRIRDTDREAKNKLKQIPSRVKETFVSYIDVEDMYRDSKLFTIVLSNKVTMVICDGPLFTAYKHRHIKDDLQNETTYENTAVVVTQDKSFSGKSRSAAHCLQRGGNDFLKNYDTVRRRYKKFKAGNIYESFGDKSLNYGYVLYAVMPETGKRVLVDNSSEQITFLKTIGTINKNVFTTADKVKIQHICIPVLGEDFYSFPDRGILKALVLDMITQLCGYSSNRNEKSSLVVHIAVDKNEDLFMTFEETLKQMFPQLSAKRDTLL